VNGETWTEYAVQQKDGDVFQVGDCTPETLREFVGKGERLVGRTVTATPWLPVQDQP
jgi:hypothetical protein